MSLNKTDDRFLRLLIETKVDTIRPKDNKIYVAQRNDSVVEVWKGLITHGFLSCPVLSKTKQKYYGFVDIYDIVKFVVDFFGETPEIKSSEDFFTVASKNTEFQKKIVNDIMKYPLTKKNVFHPIQSGYSLFSAIEAMARERGLHRVPIVDHNSELMTVITQSQVVNILERNLDILGAKADKPISHTDKYMEEVYTIHEDALALDAFKLMVEKNVSGVAVVNSEGCMTSNISMRDLRAMSVDGRLFWRLYQTCKNFLQKVSKESREADEGRPRSLVTVKEKETLGAVIRKLCQHKVHRVYIIDAQKKPQGVISLKDILLEIISP